jgi:RimJ/RimL family protein N-acetyltransferase
MTHTPQESRQALTIRRAVEADSKDIWQWRNDPTTKANSINSDDVSWENHCVWYQKSLQNPDRFLYIGIDPTDQKIGMCRFDISGDEAEVSINLNPAFRNQKLSEPLLISSIRQFYKSSNIVLLATIKHFNIASQQCFKKTGFTHISEDSEYKYYQRHNQANVDVSKLKLIDEIESIRSNNNINWMNLLRLSFQIAPEQAKQLFREINADDQRISELFSKLAE